MASKMDRYSQLRGIEEHEEVDSKALLRDTRSLWEQFWDVLWQPPAMIVLQLLMVAMSLPLPQWAGALGVGGMAGVPWPGAGMWFFTFPYAVLSFLVIRARNRYMLLPFRLPKHLGKVEDRNSPTPDGKGFTKAEGIFYIGFERLARGGRECWLTAKDMLTHMLVFGTTGAGKTEILLGIAFNTLAVGSGFLFADPKAAPKLACQIYTISRMFGRDDDFRVLNYLLGPNPERLRDCNTINPVAYGSAENLAQLLNALIPASEGNNAIFSQNAMNLGQSLLYAMVERRDRFGMPFSIDIMRTHLNLNRCIDIVEDKTLSDNTRNSMLTFLSSVGYQENLPRDKQPRSLAEQFGYASSYFGRPLAMLADTYRFMYGTTGGEVDMRDVVLQRRILLSMLPSLEKAPEEMKQLGRVTLSGVRNAISVGLGGAIEGRFENTIKSLVSESLTPFLSITDEYAAMVTEGYPEVLTQGRGLGIAAVIGSQDLPGIKRGDETGAQQIVENTQLKSFGKLQSAGETFELLRDMVGEAAVMRSEGYHVGDKGMGLSYRDKRSAAVENRSRVDFLDLQKQTEGQVHWMWNGQLVRGHTFFCPLPEENEMELRLVRLVTVQDPAADEVCAGERNAEELWGKLQANRGTPDATNQEISQIIDDRPHGGVFSAVLQAMRRIPGRISMRDRVITAIVMAQKARDEHVEVFRAQGELAKKEAQQRAQRTPPPAVPPAAKAPEPAAKAPSGREIGSAPVKREVVAVPTAPATDFSMADLMDLSLDSATSEALVREMPEPEPAKIDLLTRQQRDSIVATEMEIDQSVTKAEVEQGIDRLEMDSTKMIDAYPEEPKPEPAANKGSTILGYVQSLEFEAKKTDGAAS